MRIKKIIRKLSIFDFLILGLALSFIIFLGLSIFRQKIWLEIELRLMSEKLLWGFKYPPAWFVESINIGDKEYNFKGEEVAKITDIRTYKTGGEEENVYIKAKIRVTKDVRGEKLRYSNSIVEVGAPLNMHIGNTLISGIVTSINKKKRIVGKTIQVGGMGKNLWEVDHVNVGDEIKDGQGNTIAKVLEKEVEPTKVVYFYQKPASFLAFSPEEKIYDIYLKLKIKVEVIDNDWYFKGIDKLLIGNSIQLDFPEVSLGHTEIIKIYD